MGPWHLCVDEKIQKYFEEYEVQDQHAEEKIEE